MIVGARTSPLSLIQVDEVLGELRPFYPKLEFDLIALETTGDKRLDISLRGLEKTDFFTKELDNMLLSGKCRLTIHSAKDLPDPIPEGLTIAAITKGVAPWDCLILRDNETLLSLPKGAVIATSSKRREAAVCQLRSDLAFVDLRGAIHERLARLHDKTADGVVVAEAALIRLGLTHLNRIKLPEATTPLQGKLAVVCRAEDQEMIDFLSPIDCRCEASTPV